MIKESLVKYLESSFKKNWELPALTDYKGKTIYYNEAAGQILKFHILFEEAGIKEGDKIALIGNNSANWCVIYLATVTYGAVIVPILSDFGPKDVHQIVTHSDARLLFSSEAVWSNLKIQNMENIEASISVESYDILHSKTENYKSAHSKHQELFEKRFSEELKPGDIKYKEINNAELALISYTSGTTGFSKGVMISHNSLAANVRYAQNNMPLDAGDKIVSLLTIAHAFGMVFDFLFPITLGCHITLFTKIPSIPILTQAFNEIKPNLILLVPLIPEKIFKKKIVPALNKPVIKVLTKIPGLDKIIYKSIGKKIAAVFGGSFRELVLGGAAFSHEAENFFTKAGFQFTIGYGMTECGPLISYTPWNARQLETCGKVVDTLEVKIDSPDQENIVGEIMVKGENVMDGYYKNKEATEAVLDKDGWLHTGDLGVIDKEGFIYIKGRSKSMILGPSGKNIYPEEIESVINSRYYILESLVIEKENKLVALICPDQERLKAKKMTPEKLEKKLEDYRVKINSRLPSHVSIAKYVLHEEEFEKTPKRSLKRFKYQENFGK